MITSKDYSAHKRKLITIEDLAIRENLALETVRRHLADAAPEPGKERRWTHEEKQQLRGALIGAVAHGEQKQVLEYYGLKSQAHALGLFKARSLDELRYGVQVNIHLKRFKLRLTGSTLHSIDRAYRRREVELDSEAIGALVANPVGWIKANLDVVKYLLRKEEK